MRRVRLSGGETAMVDDDDYEAVSKHTWYCMLGYAWTNIPTGNPAKRQYKQSMHRLVMGSPPNILDHINRNKLDNRKKNLRHADAVINGWNRKDNNPYRVYWHKRHKKYLASVYMLKGKIKYLGYHATKAGGKRAIREFLAENPHGA